IVFNLTAVGRRGNDLRLADSIAVTLRQLVLGSKRDRQVGYVRSNRQLRALGNASGNVSSNQLVDRWLFRRDSLALSSWVGRVGHAIYFLWRLVAYSYHRHNK